MIRAIKKWLKNKRGRKIETMEFYNPPRMSQVQNFEYERTFATVSNPIGTINSLATGQLFDIAENIPKDLREEKKPVEVVAEIVAPKPAIQMGAIKEQIKIVEARMKVLRKFQGQTYDEKYALMYLRARLGYKKYEKLFTWALTTDEMIQALIKKYKVQFVGFSGYSKSLPNEAMKELEKFSLAWEKVVEEEREPQLMMITDYKGTEHKKDPILLAESPFGKWWYILGAWDKEVEIVDELVYGGK